MTMPRGPLFQIGDLVVERYPMKGITIGTVVEVYTLGNDYRFVVNFTDGTQGVMFEHELVQATDPS